MYIDLDKRLQQLTNENIILSSYRYLIYLITFMLLSMHLCKRLRENSIIYCIQNDVFSIKIICIYQVKTDNEICDHII